MRRRAPPCRRMRRRAPPAHTRPSGDEFVFHRHTRLLDVRRAVALQEVESQKDPCIFNNIFPNVQNDPIRYAWAVQNRRFLKFLYTQ